MFCIWRKLMVSLSICYSLSTSCILSSHSPALANSYERTTYCLLPPPTCCSVSTSKSWLSSLYYITFLCLLQVLSICRLFHSHFPCHLFIVLGLDNLYVFCYSLVHGGHNNDKQTRTGCSSQASSRNDRSGQEQDV